MFNRSRMLLAGLMAALSGNLPEGPKPNKRAARRFAPTITRMLMAPSASRYRPHQGERERLRRVGGLYWEQYKAMDRLRRGLA